MYFRGGYEDYSAEGILVNIFGFCVIAIAVLVTYIATDSNFVREPLPEEHIQLKDPAE